MTTPDPRKLLFVSWAPHCSRSDTIARRLGGTSYMVYASRWGSRYSTILFKYLSQGIQTLRLLLAEKPRRVYVMTPPVVACVPVWLYARLTKTAFAIDAHTGAFLDPRWRRLLPMHRFFSRRAITTTVTNQYLHGIVLGWGASSYIVADVPVALPNGDRIALPGPCRMTLVASFTPDEPLSSFLGAARQLPDIHFYITGDVNDVDPALIAAAPTNAEFTGFLPDRRYRALLQSSDAIICLTTRDHTMQRGAYEAVYLAKPVVTSNFEILRQAFPKGAVHVDIAVEDIVRGLAEMRNNLEKYQDEVRELRQEKLAQWDRTETELRRLLWSQPTSA